MEISRVSVEIFHIDLTATLYDGQPATIDACDFAFCERGGPTKDTVWATVTVTDPDDVEVIVAGPDVDPAPAGGLVCPSPRGRLYGRDVDTPETIVGYIDTVEVTA